MQADIQYPSEAIVAKTHASGSVLVRFTYHQGRLGEVRIIQSSGSPSLDAAIADQIPAMQLPRARGPGADTPHRFQLRLFIGPINHGFLESIHRVIQEHVSYPRTALARGDHGVVVAGFEYRNGQVIHPEIAKSSGSSVLDQAVIDELSTIKLPAPPPVLRDALLKFQFGVCFSLANVPCPLITPEMRYVAGGKTVPATNSSCTEIGFQYLHKKVADVHVINSSGNTGLDDAALRVVAQAQFPPPTASLVKQYRNFSIPVCGSGQLGNSPTQH
ncbi:MAG: TonB family protein [Gammaproteobacteria bacterium]